MGRGVVAAHVVAVIGGDDGGADLAGDRPQRLVEVALLWKPVVLQLDVEAVCEELPVEAGRTHSHVALAADEVRYDLAAHAARETDEAFGVLPQKLFVDPGPVVKAGQIAFRYELYEVLVAGEVFDQQGQMVVRLAAGRLGAVAPVAGRHVDLAADNRLDAGIEGLSVKPDGAEKVAVVGHRHGGHPVLVNLIEERPEPNRPVKQAVLRVEV